MTLKEDVLQRIDLQALAERYGAQFNRALSSPCPIHKGDNPNAFHLYGDRRDRWHCFTNCPTDRNDGNAIDLVMAVENLDFKAAFAMLVREAGLELGDPRSGSRGRPAPRAAAAAPARPGQIRAANEPHPLWAQRAEAFVAYAQRTLWSPKGQLVVRWLVEERGLKPAEILKAGLGFNPADVYDAPAKWGDDGERKIYCSMGVVIPHRVAGQLRFVNVRRPLPGDSLAEAMDKHVTFTEREKYAGPRGGRRGLYGLDQMRHLPVAIMTEGEFDCLLARQAVGEIADVVTIGGARMKLDVRGAAALLSASHILATYDEDETGDKGRAYLAGVTDRVEVLRVPHHDLTDYWKHGGPLRAWLADQIMRRMERLLSGLDEDAQPETFVRWLEIFERARQACAPRVESSVNDPEFLGAVQMQIGQRVIHADGRRVVMA